MLKIKICGITNTEDAVAAIEYGADALGFVFYPNSPRNITPEAARSIIQALPPFITTVGVFVDEDISSIEKTISYVRLNAVQLHGSEPPENCNLGRKVIKAFRIKNISDLESLHSYKNTSAYLLDTYSPHAYGGTGQVFNWNVAIDAKKFGRIILAGGLTPENILEAVKMVQPYGVDVSSGVEGSIKGRKDHNKLRLFIERARKASMKHA